MKGFFVLYEFFIFLLILLYLTIIIAGYTSSEMLSKEQIRWIDYSFIGYFAIEYIIRLYKSDNKRKFFKENIFDLIALIPFDAYFKVARLMRLVRLVRIMKVSKTLQGVFKTGGLTYVFIFTFLVMMWGAISNFIFENGHNSSIKSVGDSIWWAMVTVSSVGYGDIYPVTIGGRIVAGILMLVGIGLIGSITGSMAIYFSNIERTIQLVDDPLDHDENDLHTYITKQVKKIDTLDEEGLEHLIDSIKVLYRKKMKTGKTIIDIEENSGGSKDDM
ncbi:ion transporter [Psychrobacillus glaciei]|uniref:Ion transporter n=1 Tax=Psychrobacillus glaciei TaxID=2283160 RepID=A0A5J6SM43_9BACI|nr:ion transporter [Psychrobacillus glaciei]QFF99070.1 ion transporter [Psychrobacillus glaciei]